MVGVLRDEVFGPTVSFGAGGTAVEVLKDRAVALPPLNEFIARDVIQQTRVAKLLGAFRNMPPVNVQAIESVLLRLSAMACELPYIQELDVNPLIADEEGAIAVDARVVVDYYPLTADPYGHMAIYPYPSHLSSGYQLADGRDIVIRPIRPEDAEIETRSCGTSRRSRNTSASCNRSRSSRTRCSSVSRRSTTTARWRLS